MYRCAVVVMVFVFGGRREGGSGYLSVDLYSYGMTLCSEASASIGMKR